MTRVYVSESTAGMEPRYTATAQPHAYSQPYVPETVQAAARVLLDNPLRATRPGISAMFNGQPVPAVNSFADLDAIVHRWLRALAGEGEG